MLPLVVNTLGRRQDFQMHFLNEDVRMLIKISLKFVAKGSNVKLALFQHFFQVVVSRRPGDKPLSEPMMVSLLTYIAAYMRHSASSVGLKMVRVEISTNLGVVPFTHDWQSDVGRWIVFLRISSMYLYLNRSYNLTKLTQS